MSFQTLNVSNSRCPNWQAPCVRDGSNHVANRIDGRNAKAAEKFAPMTRHGVPSYAFIRNLESGESSQNKKANSVPDDVSPVDRNSDPFQHMTDRSLSAVPMLLRLIRETVREVTSFACKRRNCQWLEVWAFDKGCHPGQHMDEIPS